MKIKITIILATVLLASRLNTAEIDIFTFPPSNNEVANIADYYNQDFELVRAVRDISSNFGMDFKLMCALIQIESSWNKKALSKANAYGLCQIREIANTEIGGSFNRYDTYENIVIGVMFLDKLIKQYGNVYDALRHYNAGTKEEYIDSGKRYADNIMLEYERLSSI